MKTSFQGMITSFLKPDILVLDLIGGLLTGMIEIVIAISFASLIFSGSLSGFLPRTVGLLLAGSAIVVAVVGMTSSYPVMYGSLQDAPAAILALTATEIARNLASNSSPEGILTTVIVSIGLTTLTAGACFLLIGRFKLGMLVRYLPYPVVGGFLAGTGWVLALGGIGVMIDTSLEITNLRILLEPGLLRFWFPGFVFAIILILLLNRTKHSLIFPGAILGAITIFYLITLLAGTSIFELGQAGWLMGPFPQGGIWQPLSLSELNNVNWSQVLKQVGNLGTAVLMSTIAILLNTSGLEMVLGKDLDVDQELQSAGYANLAAGLFGSPIGFHRISSTSLLQKLGSHSRLSLLFASLICLGPLFIGATFLSLIPRLVVGGLLLTIGMDFLIQWVYKTWHQLPMIDWLIIMLILGTIATVGFLKGVGVGIIAAIVMFVVSYSRINVVKRAGTGKVYHSTLTRPRSQRIKLAAINQSIVIIELQGFIFFGTASQILAAINTHLEDTIEHCYLILDFSRVSGIDSSVTFGFNKIKLFAKERGTSLIFTGLSRYLARQIDKAGVLEGNTIGIEVFDNLDEGVEWCENQLLDESATSFSKSLKEQLSEILRNPEQINSLDGYLERLELPAGEVLIREGEHSDALYIIESGQVTSLLERPGQNPLRLQTMIGENVVGEVGVYSDLPRTATVVVEQPSIIYKLTEQDLKRMESENPETAIYFHKLMAKLMAERVAHTTKVVEGLK